MELVKSTLPEIQFWRLPPDKESVHTTMNVWSYSKRNEKRLDKFTYRSRGTNMKCKVHTELRAVLSSHLHDKGQLYRPTTVCICTHTHTHTHTMLPKDSYSNVFEVCLFFQKVTRYSGSCVIFGQSHQVNAGTVPTNKPWPLLSTSFLNHQA